MSDPTLRLSLDVSAVPDQPVGAGRYTIDLVGALLARADVTATLWCRRGDAARWQAMRAAGAVRVEAVVPSNRPLRLAWEQARLPGLLGGARVAVHHGPHYTMPERARLPRVVTVHDLTFLEHREWHERSKVVVFRRAIRVAAREAEAVVCVSDRTAERLEALCAPTGRVFVVPHGVDHERFRPAPGAEDADDAVLAWLGVRRPYLVFVGTLEPRKAVPDLVAAFDVVAEAHPELSLVLAGRPGWGMVAVERALAASRAGGRIVRTGYVPDEAVPVLLRRATAAVYPAIEEGFGLPALEALACGVPLVTTTGTTMAALSQGAAFEVRPGSVAALAEALLAVAGGGAEVEQRRHRGLSVAAAHTWAASATGHMEAYRWAAGRPPGSASGAGGTR